MTYCTQCGKLIADDAHYCPYCGAPANVTTGSSPAHGGTAPTDARSGIDAIMRSQHVQDYWLRRFIAIVIDFIIVSIVFVVIVLIFLIPAVIVGAFTGIPILTGILGAVAFPLFVGILMILYFPFAEVTYGATLGKSIMRLRVATADGRRLSLGQAFIRNLSKIYWLLLLLDVIIGLVIEPEYRQKLSDKFAGTIVVSA
jgi:uncharacterized RDD family membrane protein YckC